MDKRFKTTYHPNQGRRRNLADVVMFWGLLVCFVPSLLAGILSDAQKYYEEGNVAEALEKFQRVQYKDSNEVTLLYNLANCHYKLDATDLAVELFEKVLAQSSDSTLTAKANFNLGNCFFQQAASQLDGNMQDVLKTLQSSVKHYRQALLTDPDDADAKHNIALVRYLMAQIIEQIQQQEKEQQQEQEQKEDLAEKIRALLKRQNNLVRHTGIIQQGQQLDVVDPNVMANMREQLFSSQSGLKDDTSVVQGEVMQMVSQSQPEGDTSVYATVNQEMIFAVVNQDEAVENLGKNQLSEVIKEQSEAAQHLQNALDALKQDQEQDQQQQEKNQNKKEDSENKEDESEQENNEKQDSQDQEQQEQSEEKQNQKQEDQEAKPLDMTAQEILDKEKARNRQKRKVILRSGKGVDKNW